MSGSQLTKMATQRAAQRNWKQVVCNSFPATVCCVFYRLYPFSQPSSSKCMCASAFVCFYASATGDTWSSEIGSLSSQTPRLITKLSHCVPKGTNGGVTWLGCLAALLGGAFIGFTFWMTCIVSEEEQPEVNTLNNSSWITIVSVCAMAGLCGSLMDSILGAWLQFSGCHEQQKCVVNEPGPHITVVPHTSFLPILDNNLVNLFANTAASVLGALACGLMCC